MKQLLTMSFVRSEKPYEKRIALLPNDMKDLKHREQLYFETGYGADFHIEDSEYERLGCHITSRKDALSKNIICDTKIGEATYLNDISPQTKITGWIHAGANQTLSDTLIHKKLTCYAWENFYEDERHLFWRNNEIAGAGGVMNALQYNGEFAYGLRAGIIGRGDTASGAFYMLQSLGAQVREYNRRQEALFIKELPLLDIVVIAVRWDTSRTDHLISSASRKLMKQGAIIIDISDDNDGAIEKSISTTIHDPIYYLDNIMVYSVSNVPSIYYVSATKGISKVIATYVDKLIAQEEDAVLENSIIIQDGMILDQTINRKATLIK